MQVGDVETQLPLGTGLIIDNDSENYADDASATIKGTAQFVTQDIPLVNYNEEGNADKAITVEAGPIFNQNLDSVYLADGLVQAEDGTVMTEEAYQDMLEAENNQNGNGSEQSGGEDSKNLDSSPETGVADKLAFVVPMAVLSVLGIVILEKRRVK